MKGPHFRLKYDVRRVWECPACRKREFTSGQVVTRSCGCRASSDPAQTTWMALIETGPPKPVALASNEVAVNNE